MSILADALVNKIIPWSRQNLSERFIVAREKMCAAQMPDGVTLVRRKVVGPRVVVKNRRLYENTRSIKAHWPLAKLGEWEQHKLTCVLDGSIDFQLGKYAVQCGAGYFLFIPPGTIEPVKQHYSIQRGYCNVLNIVLHRHAIQCFIQHDDGTQEHPRICENYLFKNGNLTSLFRFLMEEIVSERRGATAITAELLCVFWKVLARDFEDKCYINPGPVGRPAERADNRKGFEAELLYYIHTHITQSLTLETVSRGLYLSRTQFARRMRQETGKTFIQFLTDYRIAEAKVLLRDSEWTIAAIAEFLGFNSSSYFQSVFRRNTGKTPSQYRALIRGK